MSILVTILGFLGIALIVFFTTTTTETKPQWRIRWMIVGCLMFFAGAISLVVNAVGLTLGMLQWIELMGITWSFFFKLTLVFGGIAVVVLANHRPEEYDEYFDGTKYN